MRAWAGDSQLGRWPHVLHVVRYERTASEFRKFKEISSRKKIRMIVEDQACMLSVLEAISSV